MFLEFMLIISKKKIHHMCFQIQNLLLQRHRVYSFKPIPFSIAFLFRNVYSSETGRFGRSPKPSTVKSRRFSRPFGNLRFVSKISQGSGIFRNHILLKFEILFLEACRFQNSESLKV